MFGTNTPSFQDNVRNLLDWVLNCTVPVLEATKNDHPIVSINLRQHIERQVRDGLLGIFPDVKQGERLVSFRLRSFVFWLPIKEDVE